MFYQHNVNVTLLVAEWRRVAQWAHNPEVRGSKPRSAIDSLLRECLKTFNCFQFTYFPSIKLKKNDATGSWQARENARNKNDLYVLVSESDKLSF